MCSLKLWKNAPIKSPRHGTFLTSTFFPTMFFVSSHPLLDSLDHLYFNHLGFQIYLHRDLWIILIILFISFFTLFFLIFDFVLCLCFSSLFSPVNLLCLHFVHFPYFNFQSRNIDKWNKQIYKNYMTFKE